MWGFPVDFRPFYYCIMYYASYKQIVSYNTNHAYIAAFRPGQFYIYGCMSLCNRDILRFMWRVQDKCGFWLRGYAIHACAPDSTIKAIA